MKENVLTSQKLLMGLLTITFACFTCIYCSNTQHINGEKDNVALLNNVICQNGDFVFVASNSSAFDNAITSVTKNSESFDFSHVGLVHCTDSGVFIIEAITKGVCYTPVDTFMLVNSESTIKIARLKTDYQKYIPAAVAKACLLIGKEYDFAFDLKNDSYYCSELLYLAFAEASGDSMFFEISPMTFINTTTSEYHPYWVDHFEKLNIAIPEGEPGLNPNGMCRSCKLERVEL